MNRISLMPVICLICAVLLSCSKTEDNSRALVQSIELDDALVKGITINVGQSLNLSEKVHVLPESNDAPILKFQSSNPDIAMVDEQGNLSGKSKGICVMKISAGEKSVAFNITVVDKVVVLPTAIQILIPDLNLVIGEHYNLLEKVAVTPAGANDGLEVSSSNSQIVSVSEEDGILEGVFEGKVVVTVCSKYDPSIKATLAVNVAVSGGDYNRDGWTMAASQNPLFKSEDDAEKNSITAALDGDFSTNFCLVRPQKAFGSNPKVEVPGGSELYFTVDMKAPKEVNYFRILHRNKTQTFIRWFAFDKILGSTDGVVFTEIASNVVITDAGIKEEQESPNISIPKSTYRYIKFYAKNPGCFYQSSFTSQGSSTQIQELYIGLAP